MKQADGIGKMAPTELLNLGLPQTLNVWKDGVC